MKAPARQRGFLLILAVIIIMVAAVMAAAIATLTSGGAQSGGQHVTSTQALFLAESGAERATRLVLLPDLTERVTCPNVTGNVNVTNISVGTGVYTVTGAAAVYPAAAATLNGALNATATVIPFNSTLAGPTYGMAAAGRVLVDREAIDYSGISTSAAVCGTAPCLVGAQRGRDGTTATTHATGTRLGQYQCNLTSAGGVPDLAAAERGQRTLNQGVQFQEGWAMGLGAAAFPTNQNLNGVFCFPGGTECWAVGNAGTILRWNGATWSTVVSTVGSTLRSVYCAAPNSCWAVGDVSGGNEMLLQWDGANWTRFIPAIAIPNSNLNSVFCNNINSCWAVGNAITTGPLADRGEYILSWNGATWTRVPASPLIPDSNLRGVNCSDVNNCWAVANAIGGNDVILRRTVPPGNWVSVSPLPTVDNRNFLGIYCAASNDCWAVGVQGGAANRRPWIVRWNGAWNNYNSTINLNTTLNSVTCADATNCWAVGNLIGNNFTIVRGDGTNWTDQSLTDATYRQNLNGVSCLSANDCWAVGNLGRIVRWNGTSWSLYGVNATMLRWDTTSWTNVSTTLAPGGIVQLNSVSPLSYADGWAVGNPTAATTNGWLFLRWNGTGWVRPAVNTPGATALNLNGVHVLSATDGWAVGNTGGGGGGGCTNNRARILRWNGTTWGCTASPSNQSLNSVSMVSATDGWAVGNTGAGGGGTCTNNMARILRWNGAAWNCVASPSNQSLNSVSMVSATDGWAVGNTGAGGGGACTNNRARILRWNTPVANAWSCVASPAVQNLYSVYMVSATDGWAVGQVLTAGPATQRWNVLRWNSPVANAWNVITVNTAGVNAQILQEVACTTASDCWAVGNAGARLHWDGAVWSAVTTPAVTNNLFGLGLVGPRQRPITAWTESFP